MTRLYSKEGDVMVIIVQCLCPMRHCILALAFVNCTPEQGIEMLKIKVAGLIGSDTIAPWCGLCDAKEPTWFYEPGVTAFKTIDEARLVLEAVESLQMASRAEARVRILQERARKN